MEFQSVCHSFVPLSCEYTFLSDSELILHNRPVFRQIQFDLPAFPHFGVDFVNRHFPFNVINPQFSLFEA